MERANWTACVNFKLTHDNIGAEMVEANIAVEFDEPFWMDTYGSICEENDAAGFKVTHDIRHPDYFLVAYELGGNIRQKGDGHIGGTRLLCEKRSAPKKVSSNQDKHFALLTFTALNGEPIACVVTLSGVNQNPHVELGADFTKQHIGDADDPCFFENNFGEEKVLPGRPTCAFNRKIVPCFVR